MARIEFTDNLQKHIPCPPAEAPGDTVRAVLESIFEENAPLRSYLLDDQDRLRKHVNIFINGDMITDRIRLSDPVTDKDQVFVFQALSGG
ncbi:MoaD/ThiS family protein [Hyphococcus flavus]|uniref:MoaD/ThiS family protein n=1 Tax=Hyphococcus flavus TaxID=1866326 RepID=A0AAF0CGE3_9PROT|nr:MoaD/ThiS family protein [Hyphococcus flavus]WDI30567.1 MoaD/ThiS family protein [Hyphococcus flavus]